MTEPVRGPADHLAALLETLPPDARRQVTAWLLAVIRPPAIAQFPHPLPWPSATGSDIVGDRIEQPREHRLVATLPAGDSQLVTIRLPADRHAALRAWCAEHGFTMASVVRGLVERFLEEHGTAPRTT
jgi:hypothetical protein